MTEIRANCPSCGDVQLKSHDIEVRICLTTDEGTYIFTCPDCQQIVVKLSSRRISDLLISSGARESSWQLPAELNEVKIGHPITYDDLLDFHNLIESSSWFDELTTPKNGKIPN